MISHRLTAWARRLTSLRWWLGLGAASVLVISAILLFFLTRATKHSTMYEENYELLFAINVGVAALLLALILLVSGRLVWRLKNRKFGSRLLLKLAAIFALVGVVPGVLIYGVSYQFVSRSIESWFDVKVEGALSAGLHLASNTLSDMEADLVKKTRLAAQQLADSSGSPLALNLERLRDEIAAEDIIVWDENSQIQASSGSSRFALNPQRPTSTQLRAVRNQRVVSQVEGLEESLATSNAAPATGHARIKVIALIPSSPIRLLGQARYLQVIKSLPPVVVGNAIAVQEAYREYQERSLSRDGLRRMYIGTLTLSLFLAVFGAVLLAVLLGNQLARPLLLLADGVRQVSAGDFTPTQALKTHDELGGLTRAFADMTHQLQDARAAVENSMQQVQNARGNLQTILDHLTAGVMVLNSAGVILSTNPGATRTLRAPVGAYEGQLLSTVPGLETFAMGVQAQFEALAVNHPLYGLDHWQESFELHRQHVGTAVDAVPISIMARGAQLPQNRHLLVLDDISDIVSIQRVQAWGEVARRLAHEIKNPLTPIQLSAERLQAKLSDKLSGSEQALLERSVRMIVTQVDALKRLVDEFRDYARLPSAELKPLDLNALIHEIVPMYSGDNVAIPVREKLVLQCPLILGDAQQLRQVIHNLLQNAQDAMDGAQALQPVSIETHWAADIDRVIMTVQDQGPGFAQHILQRAFEPYVSTKAHGTGLGLALVKKIADEHHARIDISNRMENDQVIGARVSLSFPTSSR